MQASLAVAGLLAAVAAWLQGRGVPVMIAGLLIGSVVPFTLIVISPTNRQLSDSTLDEASPRAAALLSTWNRLHAVRTTAALVAFVVFLVHLGRLL
jgi:hypothetical protein